MRAWRAQNARPSAGLRLRGNKQTQFAAICQMRHRGLGNGNDEFEDISSRRDSGMDRASLTEISIEIGVEESRSCGTKMLIPQTDIGKKTCRRKREKFLTIAGLCVGALSLGRSSAQLQPSERGRPLPLGRKNRWAAASSGLGFQLQRCAGCKGAVLE